MLWLLVESFGLVVVVRPIFSPWDCGRCLGFTSTSLTISNIVSPTPVAFVVMLHVCLHSIHLLPIVGSKFQYNPHGWQWHICVCVVAFGFRCWVVLVRVDTGTSREVVVVVLVRVDTGTSREVVVDACTRWLYISCA